MSENKRVYVAGPMSWGDKVDNIQRGIRAGTELLLAGYYPFIPHLSHFWDMMLEGERISHAKWLEYDKEWVKTSAAVIRLSGKSRGADQEIRWARRHGIPTYSTVEEFLNAQDA